MFKRNRKNNYYPNYPAKIFLSTSSAARPLLPLKSKVYVTHPVHVQIMVQEDLLGDIPFN